MTAPNPNDPLDPNSPGQPSYNPPPTSYPGPDSAQPPSYPQGPPSQPTYPQAGYPAPGQPSYQQPASQPGSPPPGYATGATGQQEAGSYEPGAPVPVSGAMAGPTLNIGETFSYAWTKFSSNAGTLVLLALIIGGALVVAYIVGFGLMAAAILASSSGQSGGSGAGVMLATVFSLLVMAAITLVGLFLGIAMIRAALDITQGRPVTVASAFRTEDVGRYIGLQLLIVVVITVVTAVLGMIPVLGGLLSFVVILAAAVIGVISSMMVLDKHLGPVEAIRQTIALAQARPADVLLAVLVGSIISGAGAIALGIGTLITLPLGSIFLAASYRRLVGEPVAP